MQIGTGSAVPAQAVAGLSHLPTLEAPDDERPLPLLRQTPPGNPLPVDHLGAIRPPVEAIQTLTDAPVVIALQSVLGVAALCTQHLANVETLAGSASPLSLSLITVAQSGERKTGCDKLATAAIRDWERARHESYKAAKRAYDFEFEIYEGMRRKALRARRADKVIDDGEAKSPVPPTPPIVPRKLLEDVTYEGVLTFFESGDPSIGIFSDEGGQIFGGPGMSRDNQLKTSAGFSKLWDAGALNRTRAGATQATFRDRRCSMHMMIKPGVAQDVFSNPVFKDQGLLSRVLPTWPTSRIGHRFIDESVERAETRQAAQAVLARYNDRVAALLRIPPETRDDPLELNPRDLTLEPEARSMLITFANTVEGLQAAHARLASIRGMASKAAEQACRIAGVLTIFADEKATSVSKEVMQSAIAMTAFYVSEAQRIMDMGHVDKALAEAQKLLDWLHATHPKAPFSARVIVRSGPSSIRDTKKVKQLLKILEDHNQIRRVEGICQVEAHMTMKAWELARDA